MIKLGELHFDTRIGAGAAGATYAGTWKGVRVAIKVAGGHALATNAWRNEVAALTRLRHPNVVSTHEHPN